MEKNRTLKDLKKEYEKLRKEYSLPSFNELNQDFSIERIYHTETDFLIREIRRAIAEKINIYLRIIETFLNPINCPLYVFSIVKIITRDQKKKLSEVYKKLAEKEFKVLEIDVEFVEEKEVEFIQEAYETWKEIKKDFLDVIKFINDHLEKKSENNEKGYFT